MRNYREQFTNSRTQGGIGNIPILIIQNFYELVIATFVLFSPPLISISVYSGYVRPDPTTLLGMPIR